MTDSKAKKHLKELKGKMDLLFDRGRGMTVRIKDEKSGLLLVEAVVPEDKVVALLSRQVFIPCDMKIWPTDNIGKHMHWRSLVFEMPETEYRTRQDVAGMLSKQHCPDGWEPSTHFSSQNSFFKKDGKEYARTTIRAYFDEPQDKKESGTDWVIEQ